MRRLAILVALVLSAGAAAAQESDPTLNDSDMDSEPPAYDQSYLDETDPPSNDSAGEPTLTDADMNATPPESDTSYLDEAAQEAGIADSTPTPTSPTVADDRAPASPTPDAAPTPGLGALGILAAAGVALALAGRR